MADRSQVQRPADGRSPAASPSQPPGADAASRPERRQNPRLRELVDEMLASVRAAVRRDLWTEEERRQYEQELADVMRRVRFEAVWKGAPPAGARGEGEE